MIAQTEVTRSESSKSLVDHEIGNAATSAGVEGFVTLGDILDEFYIEIIFRKSLFYGFIFLIFALSWTVRDFVGIGKDRTKSLTMMTESVTTTVNLSPVSSLDLDSWLEVSSFGESIAYFTGVGGRIFSQNSFVRTNDSDSPLQVLDDIYVQGLALKFDFHSNSKASNFYNQVEVQLNSFIPSAPSNANQVEWKCRPAGKNFECDVPIFAHPFNATYGESCYYAALSGVQAVIYANSAVNLVGNSAVDVVLFSSFKNPDYYKTIHGGWMCSLKYAKQLATSTMFKVSFASYDTTPAGGFSCFFDILCFVSMISLIFIEVEEFLKYLIVSDTYKHLNGKDAKAVYDKKGARKTFLNRKHQKTANHVIGFLLSMVSGWNLVDTIMILSMILLMFLRFIWLGIMSRTPPSTSDLVSEIFQVDDWSIGFPAYMSFVQDFVVIIIGFRLLMMVSCHPGLRVFFLSFEMLIPRLMNFLIVLLLLLFFTAVGVSTVFKQTGGNALFQTVSSSYNSFALLTFGNLDYSEFYNSGQGFGTAAEVLVLIFWITAFYSFIFAQNMMLAIVSEAYNEAKSAFDDSLLLFSKHRDNQKSVMESLSDEEMNALKKPGLNEYQRRKFVKDSFEFNHNPYYGQRSRNPVFDFILHIIVDSTLFIVIFIRLCMRLLKFCDLDLETPLIKWLRDTFPKSASIRDWGNELWCLFSGFYNPATASLDHWGIFNHSGCLTRSMCSATLSSGSSVFDGNADDVSILSVNFLNLPMSFDEFNEFLNQFRQSLITEYSLHHPQLLHQVLNLPPLTVQFNLTTMKTMISGAKNAISSDEGAEEVREMAQELFAAFRFLEETVLASSLSKSLKTIPSSAERK